MRTSYRILYWGGNGELVKKKFRFIATVRPVRTEGKAVSFIEEIRRKYWDASHNCYAWMIGSDGQQRCSDDGGPSLIAERPVLDVLLGEDIYDMCVVVIRYFGGTLLETGGLVRAYQGAVQEGLKNCQVLLKQLGRKLRLMTNYNGIGKMQCLLAQRGTTILDMEYTDKVVATVLAPVDEADSLVKDLTRASSGRVQIEAAGETCYGVSEKEIILFEE